MTTSLPTTPSTELLPGAAGALAGNPALADGLAALLAAAPAGAATPDAATCAGTPEFTTLLDGTAVGSPSPTPTAAPAAVSVVPASPVSLPRANTTPVGREIAPTALPSTTTTTDVRGLAFSRAEKSAASTACDVDALAPRAPVSADTPTTPTLPDRATLEAVVALLAPLAVVVAPEQPTLALGAQPATASDAETPTLSGELPSTAGRATELPRRAQVTVALPGRSPVVLDETFSLAEPSELPGGAPTELPARATATAPLAAPEATTPHAAPVANAAVAATATPAMPLPKVATAPVAEATPHLAPDAAPAKTPTEQPALEVSASAELADGAVVTLALPSAPARPIAPAVEPAPSNAATSELRPVGRQEKTAAASVEKNAVNFAAREVVGKNFLSTEEQEFSPAREEAGIGVAQTRSTMLFTPHDTLSAAHPAVPALVSMVSAAPQAAAAPAAEPMPPLVAASVAQRAVETVTSVVDAQAASKLQPVPSVQLKFKFGAEDLAVRVALRDGVVTTEFRTDSPELRAAIQHEWRAVTAQPESALRFLDPVVAPASSSQSGTNSFAQQQQQQSPGQSAAQQQQQQQQQSRAAAEFFGSVGRSTPFQPREGGAASPVASIVLPTSVHLSAVA